MAKRKDADRMDGQPKYRPRGIWERYISKKKNKKGNKPHLIEGRLIDHEKAPYICKLLFGDGEWVSMRRRYKTEHSAEEAIKQLMRSDKFPLEYRVVSKNKEDHVY